MKITRTEENLRAAISGEATARLEYIAFGMKAMEEGFPEYAQLFFEAAGGETVHGVSHLKAAGMVGTTVDNLKKSATGEDYEIEEMYPRFVMDALEESLPDAAASFEMAMQREKTHRKMFQDALDRFHQKKTAAHTA